MAPKPLENTKIDKTIKFYHSPKENRIYVISNILPKIDKKLEDLMKEQVSIKIQALDFFNNGGKKYSFDNFELYITKHQLWENSIFYFHINPGNKEIIKKCIDINDLEISLFPFKTFEDFLSTCFRRMLYSDYIKNPNTPKNLITQN